MAAETLQVYIALWAGRFILWTFVHGDFWNMTRTAPWWPPLHFWVTMACLVNVTVIAAWNLTEPELTPAQRAESRASSIAFPVGSEPFTEAARMYLGSPSPLLSGAGFLAAWYHLHLVSANGSETVVRSEASVDGSCALCRDQSKDARHGRA
jgi:hypothetical protein